MTLNPDFDHDWQPAPTPRQPHRTLRRWLVIGLVVGISVALGIALAGLFDGGNPVHGPVHPAADIQPVGSAAGRALAAYMNTHGAHVPIDWPAIVDANHTLICANYRSGFAAGVDDYGVTATLGNDAVATTGFCGTETS
jgi:hypothetical protein